MTTDGDVDVDEIANVYTPTYKDDILFYFFQKQAHVCNFTRNSCLKFTILYELLKEKRRQSVHNFSLL